MLKVTSSSGSSCWKGNDFMTTSEECISVPVSAAFCGLLLSITWFGFEGPGEERIAWKKTLYNNLIMLEILVFDPQGLGKRIMPPKANKSQLYLIQGQRVGGRGHLKLFLCRGRNSIKGMIQMNKMWDAQPQSQPFLSLDCPVHPPRLHSSCLAPKNMVCTPFWKNTSGW